MREVQKLLLAVLFGVMLLLQACDGGTVSESSNSDSEPNSNTGQDVNASATNSIITQPENPDPGQPGLVISEFETDRTTESERVVTFDVALNTNPGETVEVRLTSSKPEEGTVSTDRLIFTPETWNATQTVAVQGVDDPTADGHVFYDIRLEPMTDALQQRSLTLLNMDDESAGVMISNVVGATSEDGGEGSFLVRLTSQPEANVFINVRSTDPSEGQVIEGDTLIFTPDNWSGGQEVRIKGVDDDQTEANETTTYDIELTPPSSTDPKYNAGEDPPDGLKKITIPFKNRDNDKPSVDATPTLGYTSEEGRTDTISARLMSQPSSDVEVRVRSSNISEASTDVDKLIFTPTNWRSEQIVTVTGVDDSIQDGNQRYEIVFDNFLSADPNYANSTDVKTVPMRNIDNENAGYTVSAVSANTTEAGGEASFTVRLTSQPQGSIRVSVLSQNPAEGVAQPSNLLFTPDNWNSLQTIRVTGIDDDIADGNMEYKIALILVEAIDPNYLAIDPPDMVLLNIDDETAGVVVSVISGNTTETGGQATFNVSLGSQPTNNVSLTLTSSDSTEGTVNPLELLFTPQNWKSIQPVTVTGVNDDEADGNQNYTVLLGALQSDDPQYNGFKATDVSVVNTDDEVAGFTFQTVSGNTAEDGQAATFTIQLNSAPSADVIIPMSSSDLEEGTVSPVFLRFTPSNWRSPQTVTVIGMDDQLQDGNQAYQVLTGAAESTDLSYNGLNPPDVNLLNVDNEVAGVNIGLISGNISEDKTTAEFTVKLNSQPEANVTIPLQVSDVTEGLLEKSELTFTPLNWEGEQKVIVTGVDDLQSDGNQTFQVELLEIISDDSNYNGLEPTDVTVVNIDNETAGFTLGAISGNTSENDGNAFFTVKLNSQPTSIVAISVEVDDPTEATVSPSELLFTVDNWDAPQPINVKGVDDNQTDGDQLYRVLLGAAVSGDAKYNGLDVPDVSLLNIDDESAGFTVSAIDGNTTELVGNPVSATVVLNSPPSANVTFTVTSNDPFEGVVSPDRIEFTPDNWATPQFIDVTGIDDNIADGNQTYDIILGTATSNDPNYHNLNPPDIKVINVDDETAGVIVGPAEGNTSESGTTTRFSVRLTSEPSDEVSLAVISSNSKEGIVVKPKQLVFTPQNWDSVQPVEIQGVEDFEADGNKLYSILLGPAISNDANYSGQVPSRVTIVNIDNETAGVTVNAVDQNTSEKGQEATFTVHLNSQPSREVIIKAVSGTPTEGRIFDKTELIFTSDNWALPQSFTVQGVNDTKADGHTEYQIEITSSSDDSKYHEIFIPSVTLLNIDDETAGVTVNPTTGNTSEDRTPFTFTVVLNSQPSADVQIPLQSDRDSEGTIEKPNLTFTTENWDQPQTVEVVGQDDHLDDGHQQFRILLGAALSSDPEYQNLDPTDVTLINADNEDRGIVVGPVSGDTTEGGLSASFTVALQSQPEAPVTVKAISADLSEGVVTTQPIQFSGSNWFVPQTIWVKGVHDEEADGNQLYTIRLEFSSEDVQYNNLSQNVGLLNVDDDYPRVLVGTITGNTSESENAPPASFTVKLNSQPSDDVVIDVTSSNFGEGTVDPPQVTFTPTTWNSPALIQVHGQDDLIADGNQIYQVNLALQPSADPNYQFLTIPSVTVINIDDETAGVVVSPINQNTSEEDTAPSHFTVQLNSRPTAPVTIDIQSDTPTEGLADTSKLVFQPDEWQSSKIVYVTGQDDAYQDGNQTYTIVLSKVESEDPAYNGIEVGDVSITNIDNETAGFTVSQISNNTSEGGTPASFTVVLNSRPQANVTIPVSSNHMNEVEVFTEALVFTPTDWNAPQPVNMIGKDDFVADGNQEFTIILAPATSDDLNYHGKDPKNVTAVNLDDETPGFVVSLASGHTTESQGFATFTVKLLSEPTKEVTIPLSVSKATEAQLDKSELKFSSANWTSVQTVTVTGLDDFVADGNQEYTVILGSVTSEDSHYDQLNPPDVILFNLDDETAGVLVSPPSRNSSEGGNEATFTVRLLSEPTALVSIRLTTSDASEGVPDLERLTFDPSNWNKPITVTVYGKDDFVADGNQPYQIILHAVVSEDSAYYAFNPTDVSLINIDNEKAGIAVDDVSGSKTSEFGQMVKISVVLNSQPTHSVTILANSSDLSEGYLEETSLTFTISNWHIPQFFQIIGEEDEEQDGDQFYQIQFEPTASDDPNYQNIVLESQAIINVDNE